MKYLFINSVAGVGSTGRIAAQQCRDLQAQGHTCLLAYGREKSNCDDVKTLAIGTPLDYRLHGVQTRVFDRHGFGSKRATRAFLQQVKAYDPDVIWLHNIHGYYINIELLFQYLKTCGKQIYWTLHDCWAFTGHCCYFDYVGCDQWKTGCKKCPQKGSYPASKLFSRSAKNYQEKRRIFQGVSNLTIVVPSKWLAGLVKQSYLQEYPVQVVYNTIDTTVFKPTEGNFREKYNLLDKKIVLGVASVWEPRKGLQDFFKLAQMLDDSYRIVLVGLNDVQMQNLPKNIIGIKRTNSSQELAEIYTAADVFVNPTYEDNYPTVNLEAQACGTPVITYDTGGARETVNGVGVVEKGDIQKLEKAIKG